MKLSVINIGNSKGIRLSKRILEKDHIILKPKTEPRKGWEKAFKKMHKNGDDQLLMDDVFEDEHLQERNS